jgi:hypothetical protein
MAGEAMVARAARAAALLAGGPTPRVGRAPLDASNPIRWEGDVDGYQAIGIAHGHLLHLKQIWRADGYSLGDLLYSLPLAPCQKRQVAIVDWGRTEETRHSDETLAADSVAASLSHNRDVGEILKAVLTESMHASSSADTGAASVGLGGFLGSTLFGFSAGGSTADSNADQSSGRDLTASTLQQLRDSTIQAASSVRSQRTTAVQTVAQNERVTAQTDVVHNHNHCHAMTIEYFEVLRHFAVTQDLVDVQECLFVPLLMSPFSEDKAARFADSIRAALLDPSQAQALALVEARRDGVSAPTGTLGDQTIVSLSGELVLSFDLVRPPDLGDGKFDEKAWTEYDDLLPDNALSIFGLYFDGKSPQEREQHFRDAVAPLMAERIVEQLGFRFGADLAAQVLPLRATLSSQFSLGAQVTVSVTASGAFQTPKARKDVLSLLVSLELKNKLPQHARVQIHAGRMRYRTARTSHALFEQIDGVAVLDKGMSLTVSTPLDDEELRDAKSEEDRQLSRLTRHLDEHREHYHKTIWWNMDPDRRFMLLDGVMAPNANGRSVASVIENRLIGIVGNSLVLPVARGVKLDPSYTFGKATQTSLLDYYALTDGPTDAVRISVPTRGVFAEAVLGSCNSCEVKDESRFWRWEEAPCDDEPTAIASPTTESRRADPGKESPTPLAAPLINLQNAPAAPDPTGLASALSVLGTANLFPNLTGLDANQRDALAALQGSFDTTRSFASMAVSHAERVQATNAATKLAQAKLDAAPRLLDTIRQAVKDKRLTEAQGNELTYQALQGMVPSSGATKSLTEDPKVAEALSAASGQANRDVSVVRGDESVAIKRSPNEATPAGRRLMRLKRDNGDVEIEDSFVGGTPSDSPLGMIGAGSGSIATPSVQPRSQFPLVLKTPAAERAFRAVGATVGEIDLEYDVSKAPSGTTFLWQQAPNQSLKSVPQFTPPRTPRTHASFAEPPGVVAISFYATPSGGLQISDTFELSIPLYVLVQELSSPYEPPVPSNADPVPSALEASVLDNVFAAYGLAGDKDAVLKDTAAIVNQLLEMAQINVFVVWDVSGFRDVLPSHLLPGGSTPGQYFTLNLGGFPPHDVPVLDDVAAFTETPDERNPNQTLWVWPGAFDRRPAVSAAAAVDRGADEWFEMRALVDKARSAASPAAGTHLRLAFTRLLACTMAREIILAWLGYARIQKPTELNGATGLADLRITWEQIAGIVMGPSPSFEVQSVNSPADYVSALRLDSTIADRISITLPIAPQ